MKQGKASRGVARQYIGSAGKIINCQIGVFTAYVSRHGHAIAAKVPFVFVAATLRPCCAKQAKVMFWVLLPITCSTPGGSAADIAQSLPESAWRRLPSGEGTKGPRLHDWAYLDASDYSDTLTGPWTRDQSWLRLSEQLRAGDKWLAAGFPWLAYGGATQGGRSPTGVARPMRGEVHAAALCGR